MRSRLPVIGSIAILASLLLAVPSAAAASRTPVDPESLTPVPPPGADCWYRQDPHTVTCDTFLDFSSDHEAIFDVSCGSIYETAHDHREGIRTYVDGLITHRTVKVVIEGTWSLTPNADRGPVGRLDGRFGIVTDWATPGDDATAHSTNHGLRLSLAVPGSGTPLMWAGRIEDDGTTNGIRRGLDARGDFTQEGFDAVDRAFCG
jgi:hypothetical protein